MKTTFHICNEPELYKTNPDFFKTIKEALENFDNKSSNEIKLIIHEGVYDCNINLKNSLSIIGDKEKKAKIILNCLIKNENGKRLTLKDVTILIKKSIGISQLGGLLTIVNVTFKTDDEVFRDNKSLPVNSCINVSKGAILKANHLQMLINSIPSIIIDGPQTKAVLSNLTIDRAKLIQIPSSNHNTTLIGALEVRNAATLLIENSLIENNENIGVCVKDNSKMHLRDSAIINTKVVTDITGNNFFGDNLIVASGSIVELHRFSCNGAEGAGILVSNAYLTAENGNVNNNGIGIGFLDNPSDANYNPFNCVYENVVFSGNETRLGTGMIPITDLTQTPDRSLCKTVPWSN